MVLFLTWAGYPAFAGRVAVISADYREASEFTRISEVVRGEAAPPPGWIIRSRPAERSGQYFAVRVALEPAERAQLEAIEVAYVDAAETGMVATRIPVPERTVAKGDWLVGLTGTDWPDAERRPLAWRIRLLAADGSLLGEGGSYLWAEPRS